MAKREDEWGLPLLPEEFKDFRRFLYLCWQFLNLPQPTPVQRDIAWYLQHGPRRKIIQAFRGVGKSWITSAYVCWRLRLNPQLNFLVVSASSDRAAQFSTFTQRLIYEMPVLKCLIPGRGQRESIIAFDVRPAEPDHAPSVKSVGLYGQLTGSRADEIIPDDIEVPTNSATQVMRDKNAEAVKEFDAILKPGGSISYLGTPQVEDSLYNVLPERGYDKRIWPARFPDEKMIRAYGDQLANYYVVKLRDNPQLEGTPADAERFDEIDLMEREASYGRSGFALQFMLDTSLSDADRYPLKAGDLIVTSLDKDMAREKYSWGSSPDLIDKDLNCVGLSGDRFYKPLWTTGDVLPYTGSVMSIDPAGRGQDETAYAVVKMLNGQLFVTDLGGFSGGYSEGTLEKLAKVAQAESVNYIIIESNFGDGMFTELLKPVLRKFHPCTIEEVRHSTQKEKRIIDTLEPVMNRHKLIFDRAVLEKDYKSTQHLPPEKALRYQLVYQMTRVTHERGALVHDDRLDALAIAVNYWVEMMAQDADENIERRREELLDIELQAFHDSMNVSLDSLVLGTATKHMGKGNWIYARK